MSANDASRALRGHYAGLDADDDRHVNLARAHACEIVSWRFLSSLSRRESIDYLLSDLGRPQTEHADEEDIGGAEPLLTPDFRDDVYESVEQPPEDPRLVGPDNEERTESSNVGFLESSQLMERDVFADFSDRFDGLNALEIGAVCGAKKFFSQRATQRVINGIWLGDIIFFENLTVESKKRAQLYNKRSVLAMSRFISCCASLTLLNIGAPILSVD